MNDIDGHHAMRARRTLSLPETDWPETLASLRGLDPDQAGLPLVREKSGKFKVREFCNWSGKFGILRKVREFWNWSGKFDFLMS